ncbi:ABC transporter permease [Enterococcus florum]|uniref:ABC transporter permease n=1 Tax=Enterococcus florum TaxID=2480627 RepID=A0A4P5P857_9ENTE|nr:FtsX-like permease family protein [Enterococcus florum]GCF94157.1 ABC transporter permease [Enterococcus florum]
MYWRIVKNDVLQSKLITITTLLFVTVASVLVALAMILSVNLTSSIDTLMEEAKVPHYMQMHAGELDRERLDRFARNNENVAAYEASEFLNIEGSNIQIGDYSFADSVQDNGVATQNSQLDYLLDMENRRIQPKPGELYAPVDYMKQGVAKLGDKVIIAGKELRITGFLRDGSMNSQMAGSKRILLHQQEYDELFSKGALEYIIQFRLKDPSKLNEFEAAYKKAGLETNGPSGTYRLFKLGNAMSDGIMIAILLTISLLVVLMAFMCIRFTLLAKIEEDYQEIGVMKAIGLQVTDIKKIYLVKYAAISVIGGLLGYLISLPMSHLLLRNIKLYMGESKNEQLSWLFAVAGVIAVTLLMVSYVYQLLNRFKKVSAIEAIRFSGANEKRSTNSRFTLRRLNFLPTDVRMGIIDIFNQKKLYVTMLLVFILSSFIMIVPAMTYHTVAADSFVENLGFSREMDMMTSLYESVNNMEYEKKIEEYLGKDTDIADYSKIVTKNFHVKENGSTDNVLAVELGDHQKFPVSYLEGKAPIKTHEIALSTINAEEYGKKVGDKVILIRGDKEEVFTVCGIYANLFNGGKTAKATFEDRETAKMWTNIYMKLKDPSQLNQKMAQYKKELPYAKLNNARLHRDQTYGAMIRSILLIAVGALVVALAITGLITALFMKLLLIKDRKEIATIKVLGFTNRELSRQYLARSVTILILGLGLGVFLSMTLGKTLAGLMASMMGGISIQMTGSWLIYLGCPLLMLLVTIVATKAVVTQAGNIEMAENLKE